MIGAVFASTVSPVKEGREESVPTVGAEESIGGGMNGAVIVFSGFVVKVIDW